MFQKIKQLADEAVALQNKGRMDAVLREISAMCDPEVLRQLADSVMLASTSTSFPFDRQPAEFQDPIGASIADAPGFSSTMMGFIDTGAAVGSDTILDAVVTQPAADPAPAAAEEGGVQ